MKNFNSRPHGGRRSNRSRLIVFSQFQLTPSRRATADKFSCGCVPGISTHALTEGDLMTLVQIAPIKIFQLTPSRRATITGRRPYLILKFQLTPSRRATEIDKVYQKCMEISTHALTEGDPPLFVEVSGYENFNSRPHGGRRHENINSRHHIHFNSRPHGGRPTGAMSRRRWFRYFNSRPHGGRQVCDVINLECDHFNSRPHGGRQGYTGSSSRRKEFQLTPSRRATEAAGYMVVTEGFQLTPSRRATATLHP